MDAEANAYEPDEETLRELRLAPPISDEEEDAVVESYLEEQDAARRRPVDPDDQ